MQKIEETKKEKNKLENKARILERNQNRDQYLSMLSEKVSRDLCER